MTRPHRPQRRRAAVAALMLCSSILLAACTGGTSEEEVATVAVARVQAPGASTVLASGSASSMSVRASELVWVASPAAVTVASTGPVDEAAELGVALGVPVLVRPGVGEDVGAAPDGGAHPDGASGSVPEAGIAAELDRLGTTHVLHVGPDAPDHPGVQVVGSVEDLPDFEPATPAPGLVVMTEVGRALDGSSAALATLEAAGAERLAVSRADPRARPDDVAAVAAADPSVVIAVGSRFGDPETFTQRVEAAATGVQLPGGGQTIFAGKRYVALYGHPRTGGLGVLGEQGPERSVARARSVAAQYEGLSKQRIVPAFEIIATVATGGAGDDGNYSAEWDVDALRPHVDAAADAGLYVVLDLQSGRSDFLSQAKLYEELLVEPHVGLALDPEWRLKKGQKPLRQIGSVTAAEINRTMDWLADLTDRHDLPQKMVLLHQFRTDMITNRDDLDLSHDTLSVVVQMDGDGTLGQKLDTWRALRADAPEGLRFGWKNFYDEDEPTPSPATTFNVTPTPWWVSYQ